MPRAWSSETGPGPSSTIANTAAISTPLYSQPPSVLHGPLGACTWRIAVTIVPVIAAPASGVRKPAASSAPPPASAAPAATAFRRPGLGPREPEDPAVPSSPGPPDP